MNENEESDVYKGYLWRRRSQVIITDMIKEMRQKKKMIKELLEKKNKNGLEAIHCSVLNRTNFTINITTRSSFKSIYFITTKM